MLQIKSFEINFKQPIRVNQQYIPKVNRWTEKHVYCVQFMKV